GAWRGGDPAAPAGSSRSARPSYAARLLRTVAAGFANPTPTATGASSGGGADDPVGGGVGDGQGPADRTGARIPGGTGPPGAVPPRLRPAKGIHITVPASRLPCDMAAVLPGPGDKRSIFVIPWGEQVYVGTTDTDYRGSLDEPRATRDDVDYLLLALNASVKDPLSAQDISGVWAGLRPLLADPDASSARTADLSRHHRVTVSPAGLVTVTGGKLTTYRRMAAETVDMVVRRIDSGQVSRRMRRCPTAALRLWGSTGLAELRDPGAAQRLGTDPATLDHLVGRYGGEATTVLAMVKEDPELGGPLVEGLAFLAAEAIYAVRHEMAQTLNDILVRRTNALYRDRLAAVQAAPRVAALVAGELGWDEAEVRRQVAEVLAKAARDSEAAGLRRPARM
ncbi:MAG: glycerol-3-phosphate dehydrogenase/oxidase, partial [Acidimicrobiales bacterium]